VIGTAIALRILFGIPLWLGAIITICDTFTFLFIHYCGVRKLEALFIVLVGTMAVCFCINMIYVRPDASDILSGFIPGIPEGSFDQMIGLVGAVIMPHNLFLHSALVLSREIDRSKKKNIKEANFYFSFEAMISLSVSFLINMCVICTFAYWHLSNEAERITLQNAHSALKETFGDGARIVWAIGLLAAGQSSTMTGTYAGQFVMQGFLKMRLSPWLQVGITRSIAIFPSLIVAFTNSIDQLDGMINILQAIQLPFALIPLLKFTSSPKIMKDFKNYAVVTYFCMGISIIIICVNLSTVLPTILNTDEQSILEMTRGKVIIIFLAIIYFSILIGVLMSTTKSESLLASESETIEFKGLSISEDENAEDFIRDHAKEPMINLNDKDSDPKCLRSPENSIGPSDYISLNDLLEEKDNID
jgi:natural resistance-associated macrophage protein